MATIHIASLIYHLFWVGEMKMSSVMNEKQMEVLEYIYEKNTNILVNLWVGYCKTIIHHVIANLKIHSAHYLLVVNGEQGEWKAHLLLVETTKINTFSSHQTAITDELIVLVMLVTDKMKNGLLRVIFYHLIII